MAAMDANGAAPAGAPAEGQDFTKMAVVDTMKLYYGWLYPHDVMYKWLVYGNGMSSFLLRVFSLSLSLSVSTTWVHMSLSMTLCRFKTSSR